MRGKTVVSNTAVLATYSLVEATSEDNLEEESGLEPLRVV